MEKASPTANLLDDILSDLIAETKSEIEKKARESESAKRAKAEREKLRKQSPYLYTITEPGWTPVFQTVQIVRQTCGECHSISEFIGGITVHEKHNRVKNTWRELNQPGNPALPSKVRYHDMKIPVCPCCLKVEQVDNEFYPDSVPAQLDLFH